MQPALIDTSIYIKALRLGERATLGPRIQDARFPLWLSAVVLEELYAGASGRHRRSVERLERDFERAGRLLVPISVTGSRPEECSLVWAQSTAMNKSAGAGLLMMA